MNTTTTTIRRIGARPKPFTEFMAMAAVTNNNQDSKLLRSSSTVTLTQSETGPSWNISSLLKTLPETPSSICSSPSQVFIAQGPPESSSPKIIRVNLNFQNPNHPDLGNQPMPNADIHEWIQHSTNLRGMNGKCSPRLRLSNSSIYESALTNIDHSTAIPLAKDAGALIHDHEIQGYPYSQSYGASADWSLNKGRYEEEQNGVWDEERDKLTSRPKPYETFLEEVKMQQLEADMFAWRRAKRDDLMNKLARKEAAINDWEFRQTMKSLKERKKLEGKLEKSRTKIRKATQERISRAKEMANRKKAKARESTVKKISVITQLSDENTRATRKSAWIFKLMMLIHK